MAIINGLCPWRLGLNVADIAHSYSSYSGVVLSFVRRCSGMMLTVPSLYLALGMAMVNFCITEQKRELCK